MIPSLSTVAPRLAAALLPEKQRAVEQAARALALAIYRDTATPHRPQK